MSDAHPPMNWRQFFNNFDLERRFGDYSRIPERLHTVRSPTLWETSRRPKLLQVVEDDDWLLTLERDFLDECGDRTVPTEMQHLPIAYLEHQVRTQWINKEEMKMAFSTLCLGIGCEVLFHLLNGCESHIQYGESYYDPSLLVKRNATYQMLGEVKTTNSISEKVLSAISTKSQVGGEWHSDGFPWSKPTEDHADDVKIIFQIWARLTALQSTANAPVGETSSERLICPLFIFLTCYDKTLFFRRGTELPDPEDGTLYVSMARSPSESILACAAILWQANKYDELYHPKLSPLLSIHQEAEKLYDEGSQGVEERNDLREPGGKYHPLAIDSAAKITFEFNIRNARGRPMLHSDELVILRRLGPSDARSPHTEHHGAPTSVPVSSDPHLTIFAELPGGAMGHIFVARCKGYPEPLIMKYVPFYDHEKQTFAEREVALYTGKLRHLQGTAVPVVHGGFLDERSTFLMIVMQYVGKPLEGRWDDIDPAIRSQADDKLELIKAAGVLHGDYKPKNVCMDRRGNIRIIDFSHSREIK